MSDKQANAPTPQQLRLHSDVLKMFQAWQAQHKETDPQGFASAGAFISVVSNMLGGISAGMPLEMQVQSLPVMVDNFETGRRNRLELIAAEVEREMRDKAGLKPQA